MTEPRISEAVETAQRTVTTASIETASDTVYRESVIVGLVSELACPRPSIDEIAKALGMRRSNVVYRLGSWRAMLWADRHGWVTMFEFKRRHP